MAPGPATLAVLAQLRGPTTAAGAGPDDAPRPLFGRRVVVVTGEGGIGKTRLVTELARRADNAGGRVAVGGEAPFAVWQELARQLVRTVPASPEDTGGPQELGRLAPDLATWLGRTGVPAPVAAPELERLRIFDAALRLVEWAAAGRPVLLVAEDVHRADRASLQLTTHTGRRLAGLPVMLVLTRRDRPVRAEVDALAADLAGRGVEVSEVPLGPLADNELTAVVCSVAPLADDDVRRAVGRRRGQPAAGCGERPCAGRWLHRPAVEPASAGPVGPGDQPWALVPRMARVQGLVALARGDRAESPGSGRTTPPTSLTSVGRRSSAWWSRTGAGTADRPAGRDRRSNRHGDRHKGGRMPEFTLSGRADAPVEEVWKLLFDPTRFPEWWVGVQTVRNDSADGYTVGMEGYPDFPVPQRLRGDRAKGARHHLLPGHRHRLCLAAR